MNLCFDIDLGYDYLLKVR